jgi:tape measure domain-containing protein
MASDIEQLVLSISADTRQIQRALKRLEGDVSNSTRNVERQFDKLGGRINASFSRIGAGLRRELMASVGGLGAILSAREIAQYADAWTEAGNKIRAAAEIAGVSTRSLNMLKDSANAARADLESYADLYAKLIRSASGVAKSEEEIALATDLVSKAFKAGGASVQEQTAGIMQLAQALGSGVLQGDELRSIRENAPILAKAIADEFKTTIAGLKQLGADGKLVSDRVFRAIINAQKPIEASFAKTNATIKDAVTRINNEFTAYIGNADASAGASQKLVEALQFLANHFQEVGDVVVQFATLLIGALTGRALAGMVAGLGNAVLALGSFLTALRAGTIAAGSFTAALGPIGLLAGAAAAAIYLLYDAQSSSESSTNSFNDAIGENEKALKSATDQTYAQVAALRQLIATQAQAARAAATQANADFDVAIGRRDAFRAMTGGYDFAPLTYAVQEADKRAAVLDVAAGKLEDQLKKSEELLHSKPSGFGRGGAGATTSDKGGGKKSRLDEFEREIRQIEERTAAIQAETAAMAGINPLIDDYGFAVEKARAAQDLLTAAKRAGIAVTPELRTKIDELATGYANASVEAEKLAEAQDKARQTAEEMRDLGKDVMGGFIHDLIEGKSAADALAGALGKIGDKLLDMAMNSLFGGSGSSGFGFLGSLLGFGGGGGFSPNTSLAGFLGVPGYASGTSFHPGGMAIVGEKGPELLNLPRGSQVIPNIPQIPKLAAANSNGGVVVHFSPVIDNRGASVEAVARNEQQLAKMRAELPSLVIAAVRKSGKSNVKLG